MKKKNKILYLEILRIIACFFVIYGHTETNGNTLYSKFGFGDLTFWLNLFLSVCCCATIPLFFGISGSQLLKKEESLKDIFFKRILKYIRILLFFSVLQYLYSCYLFKQDASFQDFFMKLYSGNINISLWFLYAYLAYLLLLPFLRTLAQNLKDEHYYYLFGIAFVIGGLLPILEYVIFKKTGVISPDFNQFWIIGKIIFYPLMGDFIENRLSVEKIKKHLCPLWIINILTIIITCLASAYHIHVDGLKAEMYSLKFYYCFSFVNAAAIFCTCKYIFSKVIITEKIKKIIFKLGECTFGVYLIHIFILYAEKFLLTKVEIYSLILSILYALMIMIISYMVVYI